MAKKAPTKSEIFANISHATGLTRKQVGGVYRYSPKVPNQELLRGLVKDFVDTTLGGSVSPFVAFLAEGNPISEDDLNLLKRLVREMERKGGR